MVGNFGQKGYQVDTTAASSSDYYARMGSSRNVSTADRACSREPSLPVDTATYRGPSGVFNWPDSTLVTDNRFKISSGQRRADTYGTDVTPPAYLYPEDGRYAPGPWDDHLSGDAWVADAGMRFMAEMPNWSAIHLNFSAIDKIGHMWGGGAVDNQGNYTWDPQSMFN